MRLSRKRSFSGTTLIECTVASAVSALFLGSLFTVNTSSMQTVKMAREAASASQILQQRVESLRIANWHQITDASWLQSNVFNADAPGTTALKSPNEQLTIVPYGSATAGNIQLTRANGTTTIVNSTPLLTENAIKVIWTVNYNGTPRGRAMSRQVVAILAKGGVAKW
jgi:type II secretory pathway pseudopilin PulG